MGKYMRKSKETGEVALMDVTESLGVRTRAKALALRKLKKSAVAAEAVSGGSYLQLRSRRLEKPPLGLASKDSKRQRTSPRGSCLRNPSPNLNSATRASSRLRVGSVDSGPVRSVSLDSLSKDDGCCANQATEDVKERGIQENESIDAGIEASFGENLLESEGRERSTRESTPCSLIRDPDTIGTPSSSTRPTRSTEDNSRLQNLIRRDIPTTHEMDEFFGGAEEQEQKQFIEKYNFDPVKEEPLPGRYEWVKLNP